MNDFNLSKRTEYRNQTFIVGFYGMLIVFPCALIARGYVYAPIVFAFILLCSIILNTSINHLRRKILFVYAMSLCVGGAGYLLFYLLGDKSVFAICFVLIGVLSMTGYMYSIAKMRGHVSQSGGGGS